MNRRVKHLIVDSGAFIKNSPIHEYAENVYTVDGAVKEIRDKATLQRLQVLPYELKLKNPQPENYKYVLEFSKKTGDYSSLSITDLQILALTYELEKELVGTEHLNKEPSCKVIGTSPVIPLVGFYNPKDDEENEDCAETSPSSEDCLPSAVDEQSMMQSDGMDANTNQDFGDIKDNSVHHGNDSDSEEHIDDGCTSDEGKENDETWITPHNLSEMQKKMGSLSLESSSDLTVACVTTDFAVQNVLLQMGLHLVSVDGMVIRHTRKFILRCFACFKTTSNTSKRFCPSCGNNTLKRVSVTVNDDGSKKVHINFRKPINIRGTRYSLPMPHGGKHAINPLLCEDQPVPQNRPPKATLNKMDIFGPDYLTSTSPFAFHDVYSRAAGLGICRTTQEFVRKNPNSLAKRTGNKKNKKNVS